MNKKAIGLYAATSLVIANMVGTGVFTSLGFEALDIHSTFALMMLWIIGGIMALCGAFSYAELGAALPRSGGEYHYLSVVYHPLIGFLSGWVSALVGFAAPVALASIALGTYFSKLVPGVNVQMLAASVVILITIVHSTSMQFGVSFQNVFTTLKVLLVVFFIIAGFFVPEAQHLTLLPIANGAQPGSWNEIFSPAFAVSMVFVSYTYSGWNASAYVAGDIENPKKTLPRSLFMGTAIVMGLYLLLNYVFLYTTPLSEMIANGGKLEIGYISATHIFGATGGQVIAGIISVLLISTISSMILSGPRVSMAMGEDITLLKFLSIKTEKGIPIVAIILQAAITLLIIFVSTFQDAMIYVGFTLNLFTLMTVLGVMVFRFKNPNIERPYKTWGYPITPIIFIVLNIWITWNIFTMKPIQSTYGLLTLLAGAIVYFIGRNKKQSIKTN